jgi:hypothetical protein
MRPFGFVLSLSAAVAACSSSSSSGGGSWASQFCAKVSSCGESLAMCQATFDAVVVSSSCQQMLADISCADLTGPTTPAWVTACFPVCAASSPPACTGNATLTECDQGMTLVLDCSEVCTAEALSYTGTCGTSFGSQTSATVKCWCR